MNGIIAFSLKQRSVMVVLFVIIIASGIFAFHILNIEAYPDPTPPMVDVVTQASGLSAEEIERYITIPIETGVSGLRNLRSIRTISLYGLSDVKLQFSFDYTYDEAMQQVLNRLSQLPPLPNNSQPQISPVSPIGEIYRYRLVGPANYSVMDLKTLQDWVLQRRFRAVPGVIDVTGWGGKTKQYELDVDFNKLMAYGLTLPQMLQALNNSNINVGGNTVNIGSQAAVVRGVGLIRDMDDLRKTMITQSNGNPVLVRDVATVVVNSKQRLGIAGKDADDDIVQGIVLMRRGEQSTPTIERVEQAVESINAGNVLPPGVRIERIYDRKDLIEITTHTVLHNMAFGIGLIFFLQWLFLGNLRSALIVGATIPFALFFAVGIMVLRGESANLLSVGAIDFGLIVDGTVIMVESIFRRTQCPRRARVPGNSAISRARQRISRKIALDLSCGRRGQSANLFRCRYHHCGLHTAVYAQRRGGAYLWPDGKDLRLCPGRRSARNLHRDARFIGNSSATACAGNRDLADARAALGIQSCSALRSRTQNLYFGLRDGAAESFRAVTVRSLGLEFLPKLEEGNLWIRATMPSTISLEEGNGYVNRMRALISGAPEVETVVSQHGRPDDGTDATGFFNAEFFAPLKPTSEWPVGVDKESLTSDLLAKLQEQFPGVEFNFSQYLQDNVSEAVSGVKGENSIKLYGNDLQALSDTANKIKAVLASVPGVTDLAVFTSLGQPTVQIDVDRDRAARYGLSPGDINSTIRVAIGGDAAGDLYEPGSDRHFPIVVRLAPEFRQSPEVIRDMRIGLQGANGVTQIPLSEVASVKLVSGAAFIYREQQERYLPIKFSVRDRDLGQRYCRSSAEGRRTGKVARRLPIRMGR